MTRMACSPSWEGTSKVYFGSNAGLDWIEVRIGHVRHHHNEGMFFDVERTRVEVNF